jgi:tRNA modification GTPase
VKAEQLEGIAMLLAAASGAEHHAGMRLLRGEIGSLIEACTQRLLRLLALLEAGIDFSDQEDVVPIEASELLREVAWVVGQLEVMGERGGSWVQDAGRQGAVPLVMLAGPPNAGKSTLMNAMLAAETKARQREMGSQRGGGAVDDQARRSVMGAMAGTTRDLLTARLTLTQRRGEVHVELMDAPGIEEAPKQDDAGLATLIQQRTMEAIGQAEVLLICSATGDFDSLLREVEPVAKPGAARILVRTKADRPRLAPDGGAGALRADVEVCGLTGLGIGRLKELIAERVRPLPSSIWPERLVQGFAEARGHLMDVMKQIEAERCDSNEAKRGLRSMEILAHHLRGAHDSLAQIHGPVQADAILGKIFSSFCIGK